MGRSIRQTVTKSHNTAAFMYTHTQTHTHKHTHTHTHTDADGAAEELDGVE